MKNNPRWVDAKFKWLLAGFAAGLLAVCVLLSLITLAVRPKSFFSTGESGLTAEKTPAAEDEVTAVSPALPLLWADVPLPANNGDINAYRGQCMLNACTHIAFSTRQPIQNTLRFYQNGMAEKGWELAMSQNAPDDSQAVLIYTRPFLENSPRTVNIVLYHYEMETDKKTIVHLTQSE